MKNIPDNLWVCARNKGRGHWENISLLRGTNWDGGGKCVLGGRGTRQEVLRGPAWAGVGPGQKADAPSATGSAQEGCEEIGKELEGQH